MNRSGRIVAADGEELGTHEGSWRYTIGQRRGLRIGHPAADGRPRYVLDIEPVTGTVTVGSREELLVDGLSAIRPALGRCARPAGARWLECTVQLRAHGAEHRAVVRASDDGRSRSTCSSPASGIAPGQAVVCTPARRVVGSATIASTRRTAARVSARATGIGSMPGDDVGGATLRTVLDQVPDLPYLPELPARGAVAGLTGRTTAIVDGARLRPAAGRLAADRRERRSTTAAHARCWARISTCSRSSPRASTAR